MSLLVRVPPACGPERAWVLSVLLGEHLGLDYRLETEERADTEVALPGEKGTLLLAEDLFRRMETHGLEAPILPRRPLPRWLLPAWCGTALPPEIDSIPVFFGKPGPTGAWVEEETARLKLNVDLLGSCFFHLSRLEELVVAERDFRGRFCARHSLAAAEGLAERPLVDELREVLWACLQRLWPGLRRKDLRFEIRPTHDVDWPDSVDGVPVIKRLRLLAGDLLRRKEAGLFFRRLVAQTKAVWGSEALDPHRCFDRLMDLSEAHGLRSAFYFIAGHTGDEPEIDGVYNLEEPGIQALMRRIVARGHEIGLHPSYGTWKDPEALAREAARLRAEAGRAGARQDAWGARMHYLRWETPTTWVALEAAGLDYDSTLCWTERAGFRCGTSRPFTAFDARGRRPLRIQERPLIAMDVSLMDPLDMGLDEASATAMLLRLAEACRFYRGHFILLWHNSNFGTKAEQRVYEGTLAALAGGNRVTA